jgi:hypothetical protein
LLPHLPQLPHLSHLPQTPQPLRSPLPHDTIGKMTSDRTASGQLSTKISKVIVYSDLALTARGDKITHGQGSRH